MHSLARTLLAATALTVASTVSAQIQPLILDWASSSWGLVAGGTSTYNSLTTHTEGTDTIPTLIYTWAEGLTATVSASVANGDWQNANSVYGGIAPRSYDAGNVYAGGVTGAGAIGTLTVHFSAPVLLSSFTIGDVDTSGQADLVSITASNGAGNYALLNAIGQASNLAPTVVFGDTTTLTAANGSQEGRFGLGGAAPATSWVTLSGGSAFVTDLTINFTGVSGNSPHGIWLSDLGIGLSPIPEPSTYALLFGAATLAIVGLRRYRKGAN